MGLLIYYWWTYILNFYFYFHIIRGLIIRGLIIFGWILLTSTGFAAFSSSFLAISMTSFLQRGQCLLLFIQSSMHSLWKMWLSFQWSSMISSPFSNSLMQTLQQGAFSLSLNEKVLFHLSAMFFRRIMVGALFKFAKKPGFCSFTFWFGWLAFWFSGSFCCWGLSSGLWTALPAISQN